MKRNLWSIAAAALFACGGAHAAPLYTITDLGAIVGVGPNSVHGLNDSGTVVGGSGDRAFVSVAGVRTVLGFPGGRFAAYGVNESGIVVGNDRLADRTAFQWDATNGMSDIAGLPDFSYVWGINDSGQIVGSAGDDVFTAFRHSLNDSNAYVSLGTLEGGVFSDALGINDSGHVVGWSESADGVRAFRWDGSGPMIDLGVLGGADESYAQAISDSGWVVGYSSSFSDGTQYATLWDASNGIQSLGDLAGGADESQAFDVNSFGQIVGWGTGDAGQRAFLYSAADGMLDLNSLIDPASPLNATLIDARAINDHGQIAGIALIDGTMHGYLLTPVPEPHEWAMMLAGLGIVGVVAKRRRQGMSEAGLRLV